MKKYYEILDMINAEKLNINKLYLLGCLRYSHYGKEIEIEQMNYCYNLWIDTDVDLNLARLADIVADNWGDIQNDNIEGTDIIEMCLNI